MSLKYAPVHKKLDELTTDEIRRWLRGYPDSVVIRSILLAEIREIRGGATREQRTLRGLWYDVVKPILSRAGVLNNKTRGGKPVPWDDKLSDHLAELVRNGLASYDELMIIDGSRQRQTSRAITSPLVGVQVIGAHYPWVILFTEKDTIWNQIANLATLYGVSAISGGGQPSFACTENMIREIYNSDAFQESTPSHFIVLLLTDYDPFGYKIADAQVTQILDVKNSLGIKQTVLRQRLGLVPSQLTDDELEAKSYTPKDIGLDEWFRETGGVNGQPLGLELDALPLSQLRRMFAAGIEQHIDKSKRHDDLREAYIDMMACNMLLPEFEEKRKALIEAVHNSDTGRGLEHDEIPDYLFWQAAVDGQDWISPRQIMKQFDRWDERIGRIMRAALNGDSATDL